ncbi:hypothetical protein SAMN03080617_03510 [Algoriphagus alkaliphilus]|uniref:Natural product n=1 Tax=Algoriphagus alkaliphilus TaxID=279824 RepID=A0A1G5ZCB2_9BACT|nr:hypothetical protein SAMN03080617_03510 [Algoriphagus alkaliphilus]
MKRLSLGKLKIFNEELISRTQLISIIGGSGEDGGTCGKCKDDPPAGGAPWSCFENTGPGFSCLCVYRKAGESGCDD